MKNIFVTGATGFIGKRVISLLNDKGFYLYLLTRNESKLKENLFNNTNYEWVVGDLNKPELYKSTLDKCSIIVNLAGEINDASKLEATNIDGTLQLINLIKDDNSKRIIHLSSVGVVGSQYSPAKCIIDEESDCFPKNAYEKSKFKAEQLLENQVDNKRLVILRPTNVFGEFHPKKHLLNLFNYTKKSKFVFCSKDSMVNYVYVEDVADVIVKIIGKDTVFGTYNVGNSLKMSLFLKHIIEQQQSKCKVIIIPKCIFKFLTFFKPIIPEKIWLKVLSLNNQVIYSDEKLKRIIKYKVGLLEGLKKTINYYSKNKI
jgi:nucleoside-diphosphate-sugar epimerase